MGINNKKGPKANVFKVAGAKSLKKTKAKAVNLGLKNLKQKIIDMDKEFMEINNKPKASQSTSPLVVKNPVKKVQISVAKEEVAKTADGMVKMGI